MAGLAPACSAAAWEQLGPGGGYVSSVAADPADRQKVYAATAAQPNRLFRSHDGGTSWKDLPVPSGCNASADRIVQVRTDGGVYLHCNGPIWRSRDGGETWQAFGPQRVDGQLVFDPFAAAQTAIAGYDSSSYVAFSADDGAAWSIQFPEYGRVTPRLIAFDPLRRGRMVGIGTNLRSVQALGGLIVTYPLEFHESFDNGKRWAVAGDVRSGAGVQAPCFERSFAVDPAGRQYLNADCGFFRSLDGGAGWEFIVAFPADRLSDIVIDRARPGRLLTWSAQGIYESNDAGSTWRSLPGPSSLVIHVDVDADGGVWAATIDGIAKYDAAVQSWAFRNAGLNAHALTRVAPAEGPYATIVSAIDGRDGQAAGSAQSLDGGRTWAPFHVAGFDATEIARNVSIPGSLLAVTSGRQLFASADGGATWQWVTASATAGPGERIAEPLPVGPQPGLVYGVFQSCVVSGFGGCFWTPQGVAKSLDGGRTWTKASAGVAGPILGVVPSPADPNVVFVETQNGGYVSRDGGNLWRRISTVPLPRFVADPANASRWYAFGYAAPLGVTDDFGDHWTALSNPLIVSKNFELVVDSGAPNRLFAVGERGEASVSQDSGATWERIVEPATTISIVPRSVRVGPESDTTLYAAAGQGVLRLRPLAAGATGKLRAVEFRNARLDHYFVSADATEIAALDAGILAGWARTGGMFDVYPPATNPPAGASPVCRFYGKPELGLDTHFYSASKSECQAVRDRFADAWIFESASVFTVRLPDAIAGTCDAGTTPIYRLYNNRRDANHRYTTSPTTRDQMVVAGWIAEGYGPDAVAMCAP